MNDIEMRIAIGKACGCERIMEIGKGNWVHQPKFVRGWIPLPNYLNDLNAMHEAEKALGEAKKTFYGDELLQQVYSSYMRPHNLGCYGIAEVAQATARQRATAFLKTLNLRKEASE